jgi:transcriptional regulator GlxA family with amidase domain
MNVEIVLFDGFDEMDGVAPYEVLSSAGDFGADVAVRTVTLDPADRVEAAHGLTIEPDGVLGDPALLVVPGGGWTDDGPGVRVEVEDGRLPEAVAERHRDGTTLASVCTGAMVLAEAGLLEGRPATTHPVAFDDLEAVTERIDARVVDDGDVLTAGGVTSGIDLALHLVEREFGGDVADAVAANLVYERRGTVHVVGADG